MRLDRPAVSGLVPVRSLPGHWQFDPDEEVLREAGGRRQIELGQALPVRLLEVDVDRARVSFAWARWGDAERGTGQSSTSASESERRSHSS